IIRFPLTVTVRLLFQMVGIIGLGLSPRASCIGVIRKVTQEFYASYTYTHTHIHIRTHIHICTHTHTHIPFSSFIVSMLCYYTSKIALQGSRSPSTSKLNHRLHHYQSRANDFPSKKNAFSVSQLVDSVFFPFQLILFTLR